MRAGLQSIFKLINMGDIMRESTNKDQLNMLLYSL